MRSFGSGPRLAGALGLAAGILVAGGAFSGAHAQAVPAAPPALEEPSVQLAMHPFRDHRWERGRRWGDSHWRHRRWGGDHDRWRRSPPPSWRPRHKGWWRPRPSWGPPPIWVPPRSIWTERGWIWVPGHWR